MKEMNINALVAGMLALVSLGGSGYSDKWWLL